MNIKMKELIVMVLGLVEIIAGFALYEESQLGGVTFILLGFAFLAIMFIMERKDYESKHYNLK
ncbi:hypothetical protein BFS35_013245 [Macrococcoides goetzii]|uniref:Uncharacterized protein n=1 Tax=Macrococcoides goetzii TaxID=1891097 RepID=A0A2G5NUA1_9STAP|nr:hypothetical protein [Macrococcus goetzii]RAI78970.1 hypothetical protein BFS35_013245 [Macrococcus goetzii]